MNRIDDIPSLNPSADSESSASSVDAMRRCLERAAELAATSGYSPEMFTQTALSVYLSKNPALRERLEAMQLALQLAVLRSQGKVGLA